MKMNERRKDVDELIDTDVVDVAELLLKTAVEVRECGTVEIEACEMLETVTLLVFGFVERALMWI